MRQTPETGRCEVRVNLPLKQITTNMVIYRLSALALSSESSAILNCKSGITIDMASPARHSGRTLGLAGTVRGTPEM